MLLLNTSDNLFSKQKNIPIFNFFDDIFFFFFTENIH